MSVSLGPIGTTRHAALSLWWAGLPDSASRLPVGGDADVDVAVVGAGFTGLWTAYALAVADPSVRVAVVEAELAGFGASGRNGGWCSALFAASDARIARDHGADAARAMRAAMQATVDDVGRVAASEGIDCAFAKGGTVVAARTPAQEARARAEVEQARALGAAQDDLRWLGPAEARAVLGVTDLLGATFTPHCAALDPARLARGLAEACERRGVTIFEDSPALEIRPARPGARPFVRTAGGTIRADVVVRATEAWTPGFGGLRRSLLPVYSLMIATEPLDDGFWSEAGLSARQTFADHRHLVIYGQRTADGRIAFGGRGARYHYASTVRARFDRDRRVHDALRRTLVELFPALAGVRITHRWGGPLGVPRDWFPSVGLDRAAGIAWAGGYVGDGVATSNLAGRTLAELVLGHSAELTGLPWVGHRWRRWEPEPLRWLGVNAALAATTAADRAERRGASPSALGRGLARLLGG